MCILSAYVHQAGPDAYSGRQADARLVCNVCNHNWCKVCRMVWHDGRSCEDNARMLGEQAADHGFAEYEKNNKARSASC